MAWNYMMTYYESDLAIYSNVTSNMIVAAITMLIIATLGMPEFFVALLVILVMVMIDVGIVGFMFFWDIRMNMVSMICLLIAVGFSVDFSAHVCHTFMETEGPSRDQRVLETLVLMGNPVFHGAVSSILGILMLGFSESYIFRVFFKMMCLVGTWLV
jgi:predicted RND superfamily exporter protein